MCLENWIHWLVIFYPLQIHDQNASCKRRSNFPSTKSVMEMTLGHTVMGKPLGTSHGHGGSCPGGVRGGGTNFPICAVPSTVTIPPNSGNHSVRLTRGSARSSSTFAPGLENMTTPSGTTSNTVIILVMGAVSPSLFFRKDAIVHSIGDVSPAANARSSIRLISCRPACTSRRLPVFTQRARCAARALGATQNPSCFADLFFAEEEDAAAPAPLRLIISNKLLLLLWDKQSSQHNANTRQIFFATPTAEV